MDMQDLTLAAQTIAGFEGFRAQPYLDSAGVATLGFGTIRYPNGTPVTMQDAPVTREVALGYLANDLRRTAAIVERGLHGAELPTANQWAAMLSLAYNIGVGAFVRSSVFSDFNSGKFDAAADDFLLWDKARVGGKLVEVDGLRNRREAERTLFLTP